MKFTKLKTKAFTLVELIIVIAIIGILVTIAIPKFITITDETKKTVALANHKILQYTVVMYKNDNNGESPTSYETDLMPYFDGGRTIWDNPKGSKYYVINNGEIKTTLELSNGITVSITGQDYIWR